LGTQAEVYDLLQVFLDALPLRLKVIVDDGQDIVSS
jgi:hypothetical protein